MTWQTDYPSPLILYPAQTKCLVNWSFESALGGFGAGLDWGDNASTGTAPVRITTDGKIGSACLKLSCSGAGNTSAIKHRTTITAKFKTGGTEPFYLTFWAKFVSGDGGPSGSTLGADLRFTDSGGTIVGSATTATVTSDLYNLADNGWHLIRVGPLAAPTWASVTYLEVRFTMTSPGGTTCEWRVDGVHAGHVLDWQDITTPGPGYFVPPFEIDKEGVAILNRSVNGSVEGVEQGAKLASGKCKSTPFDDTFKASWQQFTDYASDRSTLSSFTLMGSQADLTRDYVACCLIDQDDDGLTQHRDNTLWDGELAWKETPDSTITAPRHLWVVQIVNSVSGNDSLYFTTADVTGLTGANVYGYLDAADLSIGACSVNPFDGSTEWPDASFSVLDYGSAITTLLINNAQHISQNQVVIWEGNNSTAWGSFTQRYTAKLRDHTEDGLRVRFQLGSIFDELDNPIQPQAIGGFEIAEDITDPDYPYWKIKFPTNISETSNTPNLLDPANSSFEAGSDGATPTGWSTADSPAYMFKEDYTASASVSLVSGSKMLQNTRGTGIDEWKSVYMDFTSIRAGASYEFSVYVLSDAVACANAFELVIEAYDSTPTLISSVTTGVKSRPADKTFRAFDGSVAYWTRYNVVYPATTSATAKLRCYIKANNKNATNAAEFDKAELRIAQLFVINNEIGSYSGFKETTGESGYLSVGDRGIFGSLQKKHRTGTDGEKEAYIVTPLRGHFCDVARRLITTTLWTNKGAWASGTPYFAETVDPLTRGRVAGDAVTSSGTFYRCIKKTQAPHTTAPEDDGVHWVAVGAYDVGDGFGLGNLLPDYLIDHTAIDAEKSYTSTGTVGQLFDGYDFTAYQVDYRITKKIDSLSAFLQQMMASFFANMYLTSAGKLAIRIHKAAPTGSGNTLTDSTLMSDAQFFESTTTKDQVYNRVTYRCDQDDLNSCDIEGNQGGGSTKYLREFVYNETDFGHDIDTNEIRSVTRFGVKELVIEAPGVRGSRTAGFGMGSYLYGDQISYEVARRILTWCRFPLQKYPVESFYSTRGISACEYVTVSSEAMVNLADATNPRKRSASVMLTTAREYKSGEGRMAFELISVGDATAIRNDTADAAQTAPGSSDWTLKVDRAMTSPTSGAVTYENTGTQNKNMPIMPKGTTNIAWVTLYYATETAWANSTAYGVGDMVSSGGADWRCIKTHTSAAGPATFPGEGANWTKVPSYPSASGYGGTRMYAVCGLNGDPTPADADYQFVGEIPYGKAEGYFMFISTTTGTTPKVWVRLKHISLDRAETTWSDTKSATNGSPNDHATRFQKKSINQIASDGTRVNWDGGYSSRGR